MKHAFLIMAHGSLPLLRVLLSMLDDERNDICISTGNRICWMVLNRWSFQGTPLCVGT